jgi:uncharacterized protein YegL
VIVGDASGSMAGGKAKAASQAISAFADELAQPCNKGAFDLSLVVFDTSAEVRVPLQPATEVRTRLASLNLMKGRGGSTDITCALLKAERVIDEALQRPIDQLRPVAILFSDGEHNTGPEPYGVASRLKEKADLVCVAYGSSHLSVLERLASTPQHYYRCKDGRALRRFLAAVGATLSVALSQRSNATQALSNIKSQ